MRNSSFRKRLYVMLDGDEPSSRIYGHVMTVFIIASLVPLCFWEESAVLWAIEYGCVVVFIADYIARWITADFKLEKGALSFLAYPFTPMAIVDMVTILPAFIALNPAWRTLRVLRLLRALRAFRIIRYSKSVTAIVNAIAKKRGELCVVMAFAVAYIFIAAMVMFNVEHDTFKTFFDAVYWSVVSLTTVGYGDLYPVTDIGRIIAMLSSFVGIAIVAMPSGIITAGMMEVIEKDNE